MSKGADAGGEGGAPGGGGPEHYFALPAGTKIFEFEIISVLGHGGFGITYKAADTDLQKTVAIKEFFPNDLAGRASSVTVRAKSSTQAQEFQQGLKTFLEEARLIARFQHPNIVGVQRFFEAHGTGYIVFTYETGQTLSQRLASGVLSEAELRQMLGGVLAGLEMVHEAAILHRDLKPNNIMLRSDGTAVLIDFGAARDFQHRHSRTVTAIASAGYAPPEQYGVGGQQGPWSDFYALGAIAYRCVTGVTPTESLRRLRNDPLKPAAEAARGKYDTGLLRTIDWMLRVDEADRPASVAEVRAALAGGDIPERKQEGRETSTVADRPRRRGLIWLTAASVLALASAGAVAGVMFRNDPEKVKALACRHVGLLCADRVAGLPADKEPARTSSLPASRPQGPSVHQDPAEATTNVPNPPSVASAPTPVPPVGGPPAIAAPQSPGPVTDTRGSSNPPTALLSPPASASSAGAPVTNPEAASKPPPGPAQSSAAEVWAATKDTTSIPVLETFVARYDDTFYAEMARTRIEELKKQQVAANMPPPQPAPDETAWAKIKDSKDPEQVRAFLKQFPDSSRQAAAIARLAQLEPKVTECDELAANPEDPRKPSNVPGVRLQLIDVTTALPVCERSVQEFPDAVRLQFQLARVHEKAKNYEEARRWYAKAADLGHAAAMNDLGTLYRFGRGVPTDYEQARRWYTKAIALGNAAAITNLGFIYRNGLGVPIDSDEARRLFIRAIDLGNARAMVSLGSLYREGRGVPKDYEEARRWYTKAVHLGEPGGMAGLGTLYRRGNGVAKDYGEARRWYMKAIELGDASGMIGLGLLYANGEGVPIDYAKARDWYLKAIDLGASAAMTDLGLLYAKGHGVPKDDGEACRWYRKAADLGSAVAMRNLGFHYTKGTGVPRDIGEARRLYSKAAALGDEKARELLARLR